MRWNPVEQIQDLVNKFGGEDRIKLFQSGELVLIEPSRLNPCWIRLSETTIAVNLAAIPSLPFKEAEVVSHIGEGGVLIEKKADGLYISGRKVLLYLSKRQMNGKAVKGYELRDELTGKPVLNANILDALIDNPDLIPEDWKVDERGLARFIYFCGTVYRDANGGECVGGLCFSDGWWGDDYFWLDFGWDVLSSAALLASLPTEGS